MKPNNLTVIDIERLENTSFASTLASDIPLEASGLCTLDCPITPVWYQVVSEFVDCGSYFDCSVLHCFDVVQELARAGPRMLDPPMMGSHIPQLLEAARTAQSLN